MTHSGLFTLIFTGVWCLVGVVFLAVGIGLRRRFFRMEERLRARSEGTVAEVVRRVNQGARGDSVGWYPIVEFMADGHKISLESASGGRKRFYEGQKVQVLYDPDDPTCFRLESDNTLRLMGGIFLAVGLGCVTIGVAVALLVKVFGGSVPIE
ncbi:MAG: DUF3592 domain-containing protein [Clostridia bacterium]|nr:DUF3592 domain-containing protein [Clostridia bacterium]